MEPLIKNTELETRSATAPATSRPARAKALASRSPRPKLVVPVEQAPLMAAFQSAGVGVDRRTAQERTFDWFDTSGNAGARGQQ